MCSIIQECQMQLCISKISMTKKKKKIDLWVFGSLKMRNIHFYISRFKNVQYITPEKSNGFYFKGNRPHCRILIHSLCKPSHFSRGKFFTAARKTERKEKIF